MFVSLFLGFFWLLGAGESVCAGVAPVDATQVNPLVTVPAGTAWIGTERGQPDEGPRRRVFVRRFAIQTHEVSFAEYCGCVRAGACSPPATPLRAPDFPVTGVTFDQARTYCRFLGLRLPTEVEWEKAAAGPSGRRYPWGDRAECSRANFGAYDGQGPCGGVNPGRPEPVGRRRTGASPYGVLDMAGNVWEWTVGASGTPVLRGGSCCSIFLLPRATQRLVLAGSYADTDIGFRCAGWAASRPRRTVGTQGRHDGS